MVWVFVVLTIILAEAEVELIPSSISGYNSIVSMAKKYNKTSEKMLLDSNYHFRAMRDLDEGDRRGRPDITHVFLLNVLESIVNKKGSLKIFIHTRNDDVIFVKPETRIMRNYDRFKGLVEQLFEKNFVPNKDDCLLELKHNVTLQGLINDVKNNSFVVGFSEKKKQVRLDNFFKDLKKKNISDVVCVVGGFPRGDFHNNIESFCDDVVSIYGEMLPAWSVASEIFVNYENIFL